MNHKMYKIREMEQPSAKLLLMYTSLDYNKIQVAIANTVLHNYNQDKVQS